MISRFYLAWTKQNMEEFSRSPMGARLSFALVPVDLGAFVGYHPFAVISETGKPMGRVHASQYDLLTLRGADTAQDKEDLAERIIVDNLLRRAQAVGFIVPEVVTTRVKPEWSRMMSHPRGTLNTMRRVAGI